MAAKTAAPAVDNTPVVLGDGLTVATPIVEKKDTTPRVRVRIPPAPEADAGILVDPYEHVTINGEQPVYVMRGEWVDVTVPVFMQLRNKYPNL